MMLLIQDKNPVEAAKLVPDRLKFKQLLELCQLICSCGYSNLYKTVNQGKELQNWIKLNPSWTKIFAKELFIWCNERVNLQSKTARTFKRIIDKIEDRNMSPIKTIIFRYKKEYKPLTRYSSGTEIPVIEGIKEYKKYAEWKERYSCCRK